MEAQSPQLERERPQWQKKKEKEKDAKKARNAPEKERPEGGGRTPPASPGQARTEDEGMVSSASEAGERAGRRVRFVDQARRWSPSPHPARQQRGLGAGKGKGAKGCKAEGKGKVIIQLLPRNLGSSLAALPAPAES